MIGNISIDQWYIHWSVIYPLIGNISINQWYILWSVIYLLIGNIFIDQWYIHNRSVLPTVQIFQKITIIHRSVIYPWIGITYRPNFSNISIIHRSVIHLEHILQLQCNSSQNIKPEIILIVFAVFYFMPRICSNIQFLSKLNRLIIFFSSIFWKERWLKRNETRQHN